MPARNSDVTHAYTLIYCCHRQASHVRAVGRALAEFEIVERPHVTVQSLDSVVPLRTLVAVVQAVHTSVQAVELADGSMLPYDELCIATGAVPRAPVVHQAVLTIRDIASVHRVAQSLAAAGRVLIVGNGAIAMELVHALPRGSQHVTWLAKDHWMNHTFFDAGASAFFMHDLASGRTPRQPSTATRVDADQPAELPGRGAGPQWTAHLAVPSSGCATPGPSAVGAKRPSAASRSDAHPWSHVHVVQGVQPLAWAAQQANALPESVLHRFSGLHSVHPPALPAHTWTPHGAGADVSNLAPPPADAPVSIAATDGRVYSADVVVVALGVQPVWPKLMEVSHHWAPQQGLPVNQYMQVRDDAGQLVPHVYAAGDVADMAWCEQAHPLWHQLHTWSQARVMGQYAAWSMTARACGLSEADIELYTGGGPALEITAHTTQFLARKVVLLGTYNGQGLCAAAQRVCTRVIPPCFVGSSDSLGVAAASCRQPGRAGGSEEDSADDAAAAAAGVVVHLRCTPGEEYVKVVEQHGSVIGALLIGDTDLAEPLENLILSGTNVAHLGDHLLEEAVDLADYFD